MKISLKNRNKKVVCYAKTSNPLDAANELIRKNNVKGIIPLFTF